MVSTMLLRCLRSILFEESNSVFEFGFFLFLNFCCVWCSSFMHFFWIHGAIVATLVSMSWINVSLVRCWIVVLLLLVLQKKLSYTMKSHLLLV